MSISSGIIVIDAATFSSFAFFFVLRLSYLYCVLLDNRVDFVKMSVEQKMTEFTYCSLLLMILESMSDVVNL